ncbi:thermonuclease family protein [Fluviispira multicolorata]|nr:thermonuclease family protein [Fluviispira multicolorata]
MKYLRNLVLFIFISITTYASAFESTYFVINCNDGDTCRLRNTDNINIKIRLISIDAPEIAQGKKKKGQPMGTESKIFLNSLIKGKSVKVKNYSQDHFGRNLSELFLDNININLKMVASGMAEVYHGKINPEVSIEKYNIAEKKAKKIKLGIWSLPDYESPSQWRKNNKK